MKWAVIMRIFDLVNTLVKVFRVSVGLGHLSYFLFLLQSIFYFFVFSPCLRTFN
jgi:hypothetical protein